MLLTEEDVEVGELETGLEIEPSLEDELVVSELDATLELETELKLKTLLTVELEALELLEANEDSM